MVVSLRKGSGEEGGLENGKRDGKVGNDQRVVR